MGHFHFRGAAREGKFLQRHSLSLAIAGLLLAQTVIALFTGHHVWVEQRLADHQPLDPHEFWIWWIWEYNVSLVADTFGILLIVLLSKRLKEVGSAESKQEDE